MEVNIPKIEVKFFASMSDVFQEKEREIELEKASNIRELLEFLCNTYERRQRIFDQSGQIRADVTMLRNGRHIYFLDGIETELKDGDTIAIFPPIYGG